MRLLFRSLSAIAAFTICFVASAQPSQEPLTSRRGASVAPNLMLTIDDSGSMRNQHMPEDLAGLGNYSVRMDPGDIPFGASFATHMPGVAGNVFAGTVSAVKGSTNVVQRQMRSPDVNTLYYNPAIRYLPWVKADGTRYPNSPIGAAKVDPLDRSLATAKLNAVTVAVIDYWCYTVTGNTTVCPATTTGSRYAANENDLTKRTSQSYSPGLYYRLKGGGDRTKAADYVEYDVNVAPTLAAAAGRTDCSSTCTLAQEQANFANWFTYYRSRLLLAKGAIAEALADTNNVYRIGYGTINTNSATAVTVDGVSVGTIVSGVRAFDMTRKTQVFNWLFSTVDAAAGNGTPLRRSIQDVGEYFKSATNDGPWSETPGTTNAAAHKACRRSYNLLVTDGYWNTGEARLVAAGNADNTNGATISGVAPQADYKYVPAKPYSDTNSDYLADYALKYWATDLRPTLANKVVATADNPAFWQHLTNFTVGLGVTGLLDPAIDLPALTSGSKTWGTDKIDDLWHAAVNSRGQFFSAKDPTELADSIRLAVNAALARELKEAGVATASVTLQDGSRKYVPSYKTGSWTGDVLAFQLNSTGVAGTTTLWSAAAKLPTWDTRSIYTWDSGVTKAVAFNWSAMSTANQTALGTVGATHMGKFTDFIRGDASNEGAAKPFRARGSRLGDFVNSTPVLAGGSLDSGYAMLPTIGSAYTTFLANKKSRTSVLYIGGNDGMLHGFKETKGVTASQDGIEIFAFIPRAVYGNLSQLADKAYGTDALYHTFFVDGPLTEADAFVKAPAAATASWRNYLLGTTGAGGKAVFAIDITDPAALAASSVRWEINATTDTDMGYVVAPVQTGVLQNGTWVAIFGNGYASASGKAVLYMVNLETGAVTKINAETGGGNGLGGVAVQRNNLGQITNLYAGDLKGNLWKFEYGSGTFTVANAGKALFATSAGQPITQAPLLYTHSKGGTMAVFGTGQLFTVADSDSSTSQAMYGVWDKPSDTLPKPLTLSNLRSRTISTTCTTTSSPPCNGTYYGISGTAVDYTSNDRGWYVNLTQTSGSRVVYPLRALDEELAFINAVAPAQNVQPCDTGVGSGANFVLPAETGVTPTNSTFDTNGDNVFNTADMAAAGYATGADGVDAVLSGTVPTGKTIAGSGGCPAGFKAFSFQNPTGQTTLCVQVKFTAYDRIWRRLVNPPIK